MMSVPYAYHNFLKTKAQWLILFALAGFFLLRTLLRKKRARESTLSERDQARLRELLNDASEIRDEKQ